MDVIKLTAWQRRRLRDQLKHADTARIYRRTLAVLEASRGKSVAEIAETLGVTRQSVYNWLDTYRQDHDPKSLWEGLHSGRPSLWDEESKATLKDLMDHNPQHYGYSSASWTAPLLKEHMQYVTGTAFSDGAIREGLRVLEYVWKRGRYDLKPDPELEKKTPNSPPNREFAVAERTLGGGRDRSLAVSPVALWVGTQG